MDHNSPAKQAARPLRVLFITNIPSPYQLDFFRSLGAREALSIQVFFASATEGDRQFSIPEDLGFRGAILPGKTWHLLRKDTHYVPGLKARLAPYADVDIAVISGSYFMPSALQVRRWCQRNRIPWIYWGENPSKKRLSDGPSWKDHYLRWFTRKAAGVFAIGEGAARVWRRILGDRIPVVNLPYAPDVRPILNPTRALQEQARVLRSRWRVPQPKVVLFAGGLVPLKAPDMLLQAFVALAADHAHLCLLMVGDGPMHAELQHTATESACRDRIHFTGFLEGDALRAAYLSADVFVLPTRTYEGWGVVVQEALAAGLAVLVSDRVGCREDLVDKHTGRIFEAGNQQRLESELASLLAEPVDDIRRRARRQVARDTGSESAADIMSAHLRVLAVKEGCGGNPD